MTRPSLISALIEAKALLEQHNAVPSKVEITRTQYEALRAEAVANGLFKYATGMESSILGIQIVVKED